MPRAYTNAFGYDIDGQFGHLNGTGANKAFGSSQLRFKPTKDNSSPKIDGPPCIDKYGNAFTRTQ